ncbi:hypothetical protein GCM10007161_06080 [Ignatzschineria indica]|nr:hypothetical protein GCM10007161_06080 [Ignatzschineria indica]
MPLTKFIRVPPDSYYLTRPKLDKNKYYYFHTDEDGFIFNKINNAYDRDLILIGGSSIENLFVDADKRILKYLEDFLIDLKLDYNIKNAGTSGASLLHITNIILNKIVNKKNPVIFLFIPSNDSSILNLHNTYWNIDKLNSNIIGIENDTIFSKNNKTTSYENVLLSLVNMCRIFSVDLFVFNTIRLKEKSNYKVIDNITEKVCRGNNIVYTDMNRFLQKEANFYDDVHLNAEGSYQLAKLLKFFCAKHLSPTQTSSYKFKNKDEFLSLEIRSILKEGAYNINSFNKSEHFMGVVNNNSINFCFYSNIYSKFNTILVFDKKENTLGLVKKINDTDEKAILHIQSGRLFFIERGIKFFINEIVGLHVNFSDKIERTNYIIESYNENEKLNLSIKIREFYLSASNLLRINFVEHKKSCEVFSSFIINKNKPYSYF